MSTLYIRDVPSEVTEVLKARAAIEGKSLSAYVAAELGRLATRPTNAEVVARLRAEARTDGPGAADILDAVEGSRR